MRDVMRTSAALLPFFLAATLACRGPRTEAPPPADEHPAVALERAKAEARAGAIAETYAEWHAEYRRYAAEIERIEAEREKAAPDDDPVRSVEELLRDGDPETWDPEVSEHRRAWVELSQKYAARLTELRNDPRTDPRSPLLPEVRDALLEGETEE